MQGTLLSPCLRLSGKGKRYLFHKYLALHTIRATRLVALLYRGRFRGGGHDCRQRGEASDGYFEGTVSLYAQNNFCSVYYYTRVCFPYLMERFYCTNKDQFTPPINEKLARCKWLSILSVFVAIGRPLPGIPKPRQTKHLIARH